MQLDQTAWEICVNVVIKFENKVARPFRKIAFKKRENAHWVKAVRLWAL